MNEREVPEGYRLEWVPDTGWRLGNDGLLCRMQGCRRPAVAALKRSRKGARGFAWWHYCADHMYGRKIEDGVVKMERLVEIEVENVG